MGSAEAHMQDHPVSFNGFTRNDTGLPGRLAEHLNFDDKQVAQYLGWFSIGLGVAEIAAPGCFQESWGRKQGPSSRDCRGRRHFELAKSSAMAVVACSWRSDGSLASWLSLGSANRKRLRTVAATAAVAGVTSVDLLCSRKASARPVRIRQMVSVNRSAEELYRISHQFDQFPRFMRRVASVTSRGKDCFIGYLRAQCEAPSNGIPKL